MNNEDAAKIDYREWRAPSAECVFILVHGLGTHSGRWEPATEFFRRHNISSYAVELHRIDPQGNFDEASERFERYYQKITKLRDRAAADNPGKKIFLVGESLGGLIAVLLLTRTSGLFDGLICISPAFAARHTLSPAECAGILTALFFSPAKRFKLPFDSSMCTRDTIRRKMIEDDPREYRSVAAGRVFEIVSAQFHAKRTAKKMRIPVLFLVAGSDQIVDTDATVKVFKDISVKDKKLVMFPDMYHSLSIELGKEAVFEEMVKWTRERIVK